MLSSKRIPTVIAAVRKMKTNRRIVSPPCGGLNLIRQIILDVKICVLSVSLSNYIKKFSSLVSRSFFVEKS